MRSILEKVNKRLRKTRIDESISYCTTIGLVVQFCYKLQVNVNYFSRRFILDKSIGCSYSVVKGFEPLHVDNKNRCLTTRYGMFWTLKPEEGKWEEGFEKCNHYFFSFLFLTSLKIKSFIVQYSIWFLIYELFIFVSFYLHFPKFIALHDLPHLKCILWWLWISWILINYWYAWIMFRYW